MGESVAETVKVFTPVPGWTGRVGKHLFIGGECEVAYADVDYYRRHGYFIGTHPAAGAVDDDPAVGAVDDDPAAGDVVVDEHALAGAVEHLGKAALVALAEQRGIAGAKKMNMAKLREVLVAE